MVITKEMTAAVRAIPLPEYFKEVMPNVDESLSHIWADLMDKGISHCPFHEERTPSFRWYEHTNTCYCFGCGNGGDIITLHRKFTKVNFEDAVEFLYDYFIGGDTDAATVRKLAIDEAVESKADLLVFNHTVLDRVTPRNFELAEDLSLLVRVGQITGYDAVDYYKQHAARG